MSLTNLSLTLGPMVRNIFALFLFMKMIPLLVFWCLTPVPLVQSLFALSLYVLES